MSPLSLNLTGFFMIVNLNSIILHQIKLKEPIFDIKLNSDLHGYF